MSKFAFMKYTQSTLDKLEAIPEEAGYELRYERGTFQSGYCILEQKKVVVLNMLVPLIISSGGNTGSQASTLIIQAMAKAEISINDWFKILSRELKSGIVLGGILGAVGFLRTYLWSYIEPHLYGTHTFLLAMVTGFSVLGVVLWGTLAGSMLPIFLKRLKFDPAASSAPFVATLVDVTGIIIYFSVAYLFLTGVLL